MKEKEVVKSTLFILLGYVIMGMGVVQIRIIEPGTLIWFGIIAAANLVIGIITIALATWFTINKIKGPIDKKVKVLLSLVTIGAVVIIANIIQIEDINSWVYDLGMRFVPFLMNAN